MTIKKKMGRPKLPKGEAKTENIQVRLTKAELASVETKASAAGLTVSEWIRVSITSQ